MTSEQQYYEAKVFLSAYRDALSTLEYAVYHAAMSPQIVPLFKSSTPTRNT